MHLTTRNINTAFRELVTLFHTGDIDTCEFLGLLVRKSSRNGPVIMIEEPVTITYTHPRERVLFNTARDCNPASLLYESLWMIAGRNDVAPLAYYTKNFANYSDDGKTLNGAYGYRWRHAEGNDCQRIGGVEHDQLNIIVAHLKADPNSRRAVLQMWNVEDDLLKIGGIRECSKCHGDEYLGHGLPEHKCDNKGSKDICCNLSVLFSIRTCPSCKGENGANGRDNAWWECADCGAKPRKLDITVTNRSNDLIWGLLNANYVTFSVLQEYMAARLGVEVGVYNHFSNNLHVYESNWKPEEWLDWSDKYCHDEYSSFGPGESPCIVPLVKNPEIFEKELPIFVERNSGKPETYSPCSWQEPYLNDVAQPLCTAFRAHKEKWGGGVDMWVDQIKADDWRMVAKSWFDRRKKNAPTTGV